MDRSQETDVRELSITHISFLVIGQREAPRTIQKSSCNIGNMSESQDVCSHHCFPPPHVRKRINNFKCQKDMWTFAPWKDHWVELLHPWKAYTCPILKTPPLDPSPPKTLGLILIFSHVYHQKVSALQRCQINEEIFFRISLDSSIFQHALFLALLSNGNNRNCNGTAL